jgi:hypothetical protein
MRRSARGALAAALCVSALAGCGEERTFTTEEFVEDVRAEGVELKLGDPLVTDEEDKELYAVELESLDLPGDTGEHASGSLSVYEATDGADDELASCKASADLLCYRVANVVVVLEGGGVEAQRLGVAMERLADE